MPKFELTYFRSRVGARILILFICCALLPLSVMTILSFRQVTDLLSQYSRQRLFHESKAVGMSIFERLSFFRSNLKRLAITLRHSPDSTLHDIDPDLLSFFKQYALGLMVITNKKTRCLMPEAFSLPLDSLSSDQLEHLEAGEAILQQQTDADGRIRLYQIFMTAAASTDRIFICAEINLPVIAAELADEITDPHMTLLVLNADNTLLLATGAQEQSIPRDLANKLSHTASGTLQWHDGATAYFTGIWTLFLRYRFFIENLKIIISMERDQVLYPVDQFKQTFIYTVFLAFWIVLLLSLVQIRKSLVPLQKLTEGTRQIARQDFTTRIGVAGRDEFGELAASFNTMAEQLGRQFETITTMASIDRSILSSLDTHTIIELILQGAYRLLHCSSAAILMKHADEPGAATLHHSGSSDTSPLQSLRIILTADEARRLESFTGHVIYHHQEDLPAPLRVDAVDSLSWLAIPLLINKIPQGLICLGFREHARPTEDVIVQAAQLADQIAVALSNAQLLEQLEQFNLGTLTALARAVDAKSSWTAGHSERVTRIALKIATVMGLSAKERDILHRGGLLHDIGKIGIPAEIIDKPGRLTDEEFRIIREHPQLGVRILEPIKAYAEIISLVRQHHERYDGTGYPDGLAGTAISLPARILRVADVFEAIITDRPYRQAMSLNAVCSIIAEESGRQFDPQVARVFLDMIEGIKRSVDAPAAVRATVVDRLTEAA